MISDEDRATREAEEVIISVVALLVLDALGYGDDPSVGIVSRVSTAAGLMARRL